ncbi:MAG: hypothetical protein HYX84_06615 [Chloroflexi bacterium]|nr:hypothetical protein [Chloroflexota bacterium]
MEKWRDDIEKLLSTNRTIDRWIIHDFVWNNDDPAHRTTMEAMSHLMAAMKLLCTGPNAISAPEFKERIKRSCAEAGLPREAVNGLFAWLEKQGSPGLDNRTEEAPDEATNEPPGDDE